MFYIDPDISPCIRNLLPTCPKLEFWDWFVHTLYLPKSWGSNLFLPYRGLFFYTPFLILCIIGFYYLYEKEKALTKSLLLIFSLLVSFLHFYMYWHGGTSFGQKYSVFLLPFLSIPLAIFLQKTHKNIFLRIILLLLISISILHNFFGLSISWEGLTIGEGFIQKYYESGIKVKVDWSTKSFEVPYNKAPMLNPLYEHYLPAFLKHGPRSGLLNGLLDEKQGIDIRDMNPLSNRYNLPFIPIAPLKTLTINPSCLPFLLLLFMFSRELFNLHGRKRIIVFSLLTAFFLFSFVRSTDVFYARNWYMKEENDGIWMSQDAVLSVYTPRPVDAMVKFRFNSFQKQRNLDLYMNGKLIGKYTIPPAIVECITPRVKLDAGENRFMIHSEEGCDTCEDEGYKGKCLSFKLHSIDVILPKEDVTIAYYKGWYSEEKTPENLTFRWSMNNPSIYLSVARSDLYSIDFSVWSFPQENRVRVFLNDSLLCDVKLSKDMHEVVRTQVYLERGEYFLLFFPEKSCQKPSDILNSTDKRCLNIGISDLRVERIQ